MGITLEQAVLLEDWSRRHSLGGRVTTLGVQHLDFSRRDLAIALGRPIEAASDRDGSSGDEAMSAKALFSWCGFSKTTAVDISDHEGADALADLNSPDLPPALAGSSELVVNGGTLEHVFHVPNALSNMTRMLAADGCILHIMPCHNCVDHGFYQFGPTLVLDYYSAANFEILESAAIEIGGPEGRVAQVFPVAEGCFGTGLIGAMSATPILYVALVRKTPSAIEAPLPAQRLYAKPARRIAKPRWFAPFSLVPGERLVRSEIRELQLGPFTHAGGLAWTCALSAPGLDGDSLRHPIRSPLAVFEGDLVLGPPHTSHGAIIAYGAGAFSHWDETLMISTSDGSDPNCNGRRYTARVPMFLGASFEMQGEVTA